VVAVAAVGAFVGAIALGAGRPGAGSDLPAYLAGLIVAAGSAIGGFGLLGRGRRLAPRRFVGLLLGLFLGRVVLIGVFGLALHVLAPAHLAAGLLSLVGFHFIFAVVEVALLARTGAAGPGTGQKPRAIRSA
jgi:hypothetical protein